MTRRLRARRAAQAEEEFFETKVRPVIFDRCLDCHGREKSKGGLRLDSREAVLKGGESGPVVLPGKPDASPLIAAIRYDGDVQMPPKGKLKDEEIAALTEWVKRGAAGLWEVPAMQRCGKEFECAVIRECRSRRPAASRRNSDHSGHFSRCETRHRL